MGRVARALTLAGMWAGVLVGGGMSGEMGSARGVEPEVGRAAFEASRERVAAELKALDRAALKDEDWAKEWAGTYVSEMGVEILLAPRAGVAAQQWTDLGPVRGEAGGVVKALSNGLRVKLASGRSRGEWLSERIYFVRWGEERFLVPEPLMLEMVNSYNQGGFARAMMLAIPRRVREGAFPGTGVAPEGMPELPARYARMLLREPVELTVARVSRGVLVDERLGLTEVSYVVEFAGGSEQGVYVGLEFRPPDADLPDGRFQITSVGRDSAVGTYTFLGRKDEPHRVPVVGERIPITKPDRSRGDVEMVEPEAPEEARP